MVLVCRVHEVICTELSSRPNMVANLHERFDEMSLEEEVTDRALLNAPFVEDRRDDFPGSDGDDRYLDRFKILEEISADSGLEMTEDSPQVEYRRRLEQRLESRRQRKLPWRVYQKRKAMLKCGDPDANFVTEEHYVLGSWTVNVYGRSGRHRREFQGLSVVIKDTRNILSLPTGGFMVMHEGVWVQTQVRLFRTIVV